MIDKRDMEEKMIRREGMERKTQETDMITNRKTKKKQSNEQENTERMIDKREMKRT